MRSPQELIKVVLAYFNDIYNKYSIYPGNPKYPEVRLDLGGEIFVIKKDQKTDKFYLYHIEDLGLSVLPLQQVGSASILKSGIVSQFSLDPEYDTTKFKDAIIEYANKYYNNPSMDESYFKVMHLLLQEHELPLPVWNNAQKKIWTKLVTDGIVSRNDPDQFYKFGKDFSNYYHQTGHIMSYRQALISILGD